MVPGMTATSQTITPQSLLAAWMAGRKLREASAACEVDGGLLRDYSTGKRRPGLRAAIQIERVVGIPAGMWLDDPADQPSGKWDLPDGGGVT